jgi:hypothetical protein
MLIMRLDVVHLHEAVSEAVAIPTDTDHTQSPDLGAGVYEAPFDVFFRDLSPTERQILRRFYRQDASAAAAIRGDNQSS